MNWEISNYEYLMNVNIYANRSFNDLSHYPVFPWIHLNHHQKKEIESFKQANTPLLKESKRDQEGLLEKSNSDPYQVTSIYDCLRDLTKNMGQLGSKERMQELLRKFEEGDCFENDKYHYGSHYSHPGIVLHYLIRVHPYTEGCLSLQGGQYDVADRLF